MRDGPTALSGTLAATSSLPWLRASRAPCRRWSLRPARPRPTTSPRRAGDETNDPLVLAVDAAVTWLSGVGAYLLHCGAGIYGLADPSRGRPADLWDTVNYDAICQGIRAMRDLLPADLPNFAKHKTNHASAPFGFVDIPNVEQLSAAYSATSGTGVGQRIVIVPYGIVNATTFTLRSGRVDGKVFDPRTGALLETFDRQFQTSPSQPGVVVVATRMA